MRHSFCGEWRRAIELKKRNRHSAHTKMRYETPRRQLNLIIMFKVNRSRSFVTPSTSARDQEERERERGRVAADDTKNTCIEQKCWVRSIDRMLCLKSNMQRSSSRTIANMSSTLSTISMGHETKQWLSIKFIVMHTGSPSIFPHPIHPIRSFVHSAQPFAIRIVFTVSYKCIGYSWNSFRILIDCEVILLDTRRTVLGGKTCSTVPRTIVCIFKITRRATRTHSVVFFLSYLSCRHTK